MLLDGRECILSLLDELAYESGWNLKYCASFDLSTAQYQPTVETHT